MYFDKILKLCGFEESEIDQNKLRIEEVFQRLNLTPIDMDRAESWLMQNHDMSLIGVRKIFRLWLIQLIDLVLAKDEGKKKLIYYGFPTISGPAATIAAASDEIYCTCPDVVLCHTMGQIFNKLAPILEAGEKNGLPPGHALCSLQQVRVGGMVKGIIPVPDMVLTSSYFCDMGSKADELLHEKYFHPTIYVDGSMDSKWGGYPNYQPERVEYLGGQIEKIFTKIKEILGIEITENARREGASRSLALSNSLGRLSKVMKEAECQPISVVTSELARRLTSGSAGGRILTEGPGAIDLLCQEVKTRVDGGIGVVEKGAPRVMIFLAPHSDPSIMRMIENCGLSIPLAFNNAIGIKYRNNSPMVTGESLAKNELNRGLFHSLYGIIKIAAEIAQEANVDGIIWNYLYNCRPLSLPSHLLKQYVEKQTGIPVLSLETDLADSRTYSAGALKTRVEAFDEMLRARKVGKI